MIILKSAKEIEKMRQAGRVAAQAMEKVLAAVRPGITTGELDRIAFDYIIAVSYTHLDVYKRQVVEIVEKAK